MHLNNNRIKKLFTFIGFILLLCSFYQSDNEIYWDAKRKLTWDDFKGSVDIKSSRASISDCRISTDYKTKKDSVLFFINSYFSISSSWVKSENKTDLILKHEQGHFDINEIYARKLRKELQEHKFYLNTLGLEFDKIVSKYFDSLNKEQKLYDIETKHSQNRPKQLTWEKKVDGELNTLKKYNNSIVIVPYFKNK